MVACTLKPEDVISHYRIVGPLGAGGMGEVYRAKDQSLERDVALKILPPELVRSEERVRRFVLEAKSASSLNHPHIVTIYEIGQDQVRAGGGAAEPDSSPLHFISMELVSGETLTTKIHREKTDLRALLSYLAQAAEGLAKAHAAGIVHRDLKPGNIMVSKDGYAKVLDFGLAKLTERHASDPSLTSMPTQTEDGTSEGAVLGTVGYMSPEQVQGKPVDHRSDIFSFGCILYEAATRKRPFAADSSVETMHQILRETPEPIEQLNPEAPAELRRLIRRCMVKDPNQRLDSMKTLTLELREIVEEYDALSGSGTSGSSAPAVVVAKRRFPLVPAVAAAALAVAATLAALWIVRSDEGRKSGGAFQSMRLNTVTSRGDVFSAALSPDARFLAYAGGKVGQWSLFVRQLATETEVQILQPQERALIGLKFSPDGNHVFYETPDPATSNANTLYQISSLGGAPRRRATDVVGGISFSPDGKRICFLRRMHSKRQVALILLDLESDQERILATTGFDQAYVGAPSWSPDGKRIAVLESALGSASSGPRMRIVTVRTDDGRREAIGSISWRSIHSIAWLPDGSGLLLSAFEESSLGAPQIRLLSYPAGTERKVTNDLSSYFNLTVSSDGTIAAVRPTRVVNVWTAEPTKGGKTRQLTFASNPEGTIMSAAAAEDGSIIFIEGLAQRALRRVGIDGSGARTILSGALYGTSFRCLRSGAIIYSKYGADGIGHLGRADADGGNARQLVASPGGEQVTDVSSDGRTVLYHSRANYVELWTVDVDGGSPIKVADSTQFYGPASFSPDGTRILYSCPQEIEGDTRRMWKIIPASGGEAIRTLSLPAEARDLQWAPGGESLTFINRVNGTWNVFKRLLESGRTEQITHFAGGNLDSHQWSRDGSRLFLVRQTETANVWVTAADGTKPIQLTHFETGFIFGVEWVPPDGKYIEFSHGEVSSDVVLIRNFR